MVAGFILHSSEILVACWRMSSKVVSLKCAEEKYSVVIDEKRMAVDEERTREERLKMNAAASQGRPFEVGTS